MAKFALISHSHEQLPKAALGADLWVSRYFKLKQAWCIQNNLEYAVMSPCKGIVLPTQMVSPYDWTKYRFNVDAIQWIQGVDTLLVNNPSIDTFIVIGGAHYVEAVTKALYLRPDTKVEAPTKGMPIGRKLAWLKAEITRKNPI